MDSLPTFDHDDEQAFIDYSLNSYPKVDFKDEAYSCAQLMIMAEKTLIKLAKEKSELKPEKYHHIFQLIKRETTIRHYFPLGKYSSYIELCFNIQAKHKEMIRYDPFLSNQDKKDILEGIRQDLKSEPFRKAIKSKKNAISKNKQNLLRYIDDLFKYRSRLLVIRIDLGYSKVKRLHKLRPCINIKIPLSPPKKLKLFGESVREHRAILIKQLNKKFKKDLIGYIWKLEYGVMKGFHYHMIFFLDGSKYREDISISKSIGELWVNEITQEEGTYWNLNADKERFKKNDRVATGAINNNEQSKRENLKRMAIYLIKPDYFVKTALPNNARTFGKGEVPKKIKSGRPRK